MNRADAVSIPRSFVRSADRAGAHAWAGSGFGIAALAIAGGALAVRIGFGAQLDGMDDAGYLNAAQRIAQGQPLDTLFALFRTRVGMSYPLGWLIEHGWLSASGFWILTLTADLVTVGSLVVAGWLFTGAPLAGLCAAALYAIYPLAVQQSMLYYPTAFQVASIALACALIAWAGHEQRTLRGSLIAGAGAGVALGIGYLFKEDVAIVVPAIAIASLIARYPRLGTTAAVCGGAAAVFAIECLLYWQTTGAPLFRLTATSGLGAPVADELQIAEIWRWDAYLRSLFLMPVAVGLVWWCLVAALVTAWWSRRSRWLAFMAVLFAIVMAYLQFGSGTLSSYSPLPKSPRYTALVTPLVMLLVGRWMAMLFTHRRRIAVMVAAALVAVAVPCIIYLSVSSSERARNTLAVIPVVAQLPPGPVYSDYYTARILRLTNPERDIRVWYHADFKANAMVVHAAPPAGAFVVFDSQAAKVYTSSYQLPLPTAVAEPLPAWQPLWTHRAYADDSLTRTWLEGLRASAAWLPDGNPLGSRIARNVADMIDGDRATLYRVP